MKCWAGLAKTAVVAAGAALATLHPAAAGMRTVDGQSYWTGDPGPIDPGAFFDGGQFQYDPHHYLSWYGEDPQDYKMTVYAPHSGSAAASGGNGSSIPTGNSATPIFGCATDPGSGGDDHSAPLLGRSKPSPQESATWLARQKARGPGSETGPGRAVCKGPPAPTSGLACRPDRSVAAPTPACANNGIGRKARDRKRRRFPRIPRSLAGHASSASARSDRTRGRVSARAADTALSGPSHFPEQALVAPLHD